MRRRRIKNVSEFKDRHGKWRVMYRRTGFGSYNFKHPVGSEGFWQEYHACERGQRPGEIEAPLAQPSGTPTMDDLIRRYYASSDFESLKPATQKDYRSVIEEFRKAYGKAKVMAFTPPLVYQIIQKKKKTPTRANKLKKRLRTLFNLAMFLGWRTSDPMAGVKKLAEPGRGFHTWTEEEIQKFEAYHPTGSKARLAFTIMLYTGVRRSDLVTMGRQHVANGHIRIQPVKTQRTGNWVHVPIHPKLQAELDQLPDNQMQFLLTEYGKPFTSNGFGNKMRVWCDDAGLPNCSSHGLRKAIARRLAELGVSAKGIGAVIGDKDLKQIQTYTEDADNAKLASDSIAKLKD